MKNCLIAMIAPVLFAGAVLAQQNIASAGAIAMSGVETPAAVNVSTTDAALQQTMKELQALQQFDEKERAEISSLENKLTAVTDQYLKKQMAEMRAMEEKLKPIAQRYQEETNAVKEQIKSLKDKYRAERYALMDRLNPGSGAAQAKRDQDIADAETQRRKDIDALASRQQAQMSAGGNPRSGMDRYQADRKAIDDAFNAKMKELLSKPFGK